ncbi:MAG TPA: flagellar protein FliT [Gammaproteobacteria bacterium]|nr:flagellar protein FliT [Gammaproteobacteria bacterium]
MNATVRQQLAGLLELANRMQARAAASDWDEVARLRDRFQQCVEALFAGQVRRDEASALSEVIGRISAINDGVIALCRDARDAQGRDLENLKQGRRAISSYAANTG